MDEKNVYTAEDLKALVKEYVTRNDSIIGEAIREASLGESALPVMPSDHWYKFLHVVRVQ